MRIVNFINPSLNKENADAYHCLVTCSVSGFGYKQTSDMLSDIGFYVPKDQYKVFDDLLNIMIDLDIGNRREEKSI